MGPWSAAVRLRRSAGPLFEYACHEGNYPLTNILRGARADPEEILWRSDVQPVVELRVHDFADVGETVRLEAGATARQDARVERVEFLVDETVVGLDTTAPYAVTWRSTDVGHYALTAAVVDSAGRISRSSPSKPFFVGLSALERSPIVSADDAEEDAAASVNLASRGLDLGLNNCSLVAVRFEDIQVPRDAKVKRAYVQFSAGASLPNSDDATLVAHAELEAIQCRSTPRRGTSHPGKRPPAR